MVFVMVLVHFCDGAGADSELRSRTQVFRLGLPAMPRMYAEQWLQSIG